MEYENDPIYQLLQDFEKSHGAGTLSLQVKFEGNSKQVSIYIPYMDYLVPEITEALQIVNGFEPGDGKPYQPIYWIAWIGKEDPCEPYMLEFLPWPNRLLNPTAFLNGSDEGQFVIQSNNDELNLLQLLCAGPSTFIYVKDGLKYYIYTRPLLPDELPSKF